MSKNDDLMCPICGEPTDFYFGHPRRDRLCSKHGFLVNMKKIVKNKDGYYVNAKTGEVLNQANNNKSNDKSIVKNESQIDLKYLCECGNEINTTMNFCPNCGKNVKEILNDEEKCFALGEKYFNKKNNQVAFSYYYRTVIELNGNNLHAFFMVARYFYSECKGRNYSFIKASKDYCKKQYEDIFSFLAINYNHKESIGYLKNEYPNISNVDGKKCIKRIVDEEKEIERKKILEEENRIREDRLKYDKEYAKSELKVISNNINDMIKELDNLDNIELLQKNIEEINCRINQHYILGYYSHDVYFVNNNEINLKDLRNAKNRLENLKKEKDDEYVHRVLSAKTKEISLLIDDLNKINSENISLLKKKTEEIEKVIEERYKLGIYEKKYYSVNPKKIKNYNKILEMKEYIKEKEEEIKQKEILERQERIRKEKEKYSKVLEVINRYIDNYNIIPIYRQTIEGLGEKGKIVKVEMKDEYRADLYAEFPSEKRVLRYEIPYALDNKYIAEVDIWEKEKINEYVDSEFDIENNHYLEVRDMCLKKSKDDYEAEPVTFTCSPKYEDYELQGAIDKIETDTMQSKWRDIAKNPFFASTKSTKYGKIYIGKNEIDEYVIDYRDKKAALYYNYAGLMFDADLDLIYVRDHMFYRERYDHFTDKYNKESNTAIELGSGDKYLAQLLEIQRNEKKTHDIIETIQKNQYEIISNMDDKNICVYGCAGSGKTMVLFHKIAYIIFNEPDIYPYNICVLSSNKYLENEANVLCKDLNIEKIKNYNTYYFYKLCINKYIEAHKTNICIPEVGYNQVIYNDVYYFKRMGEIRDKLFANLSQYNSDFNKWMSNRLCKLYNRIFNSNAKKIEEINVTGILESDELFSTIKDIPFLNLLIEPSNSKGFEAITKEIYSQLIDYFREYLSNVPEYSQKGELMTDFDAMKNLSTILKSKCNYQSQSSFNPKFCGDSHLVQLYDKILFVDEFTRYSLYLNDEKRIALINELKKEILLIYEDSNLNEQQKEKLISNVLYEYRDVLKNEYYMLIEAIDYTIVNENDFEKWSNNDKLFVIAYLLLPFNSKFEDFNYLLIDEFQNYSKLEFELIIKMCNKPKIMLFGDDMQIIDEKAINSLDELGLDFKEYKLNANYRNSYEICDYINKEFNMNLIPLGIRGKVETIDVSSVLTIDKTDDRTCLITKGTNYIDLNFLSPINIVSKTNEIKKGVINILDISDVKGLEFEKVFVLPKSMSRNEKYVAYTRALNHLVIIE